MLITVTILGCVTLASLALAVWEHLQRRTGLDRSDILTLLGNHRAFHDNLASELSRARRRHHSLTLALLDIDDFTTINDLRGHAAADKILVAASNILRAGRPEDRAYRIGGDKFGVLFVETSEREAKIAVARIQRRIQETIEDVSLSIGLCELAPDYDTQDLYKRAEAALLAAKHTGRNTIVQFCEIEEHTKIFPSRKSVALLDLLRKEALEFAFQPIVKLDESGLLGFEALARPDPALGFSGPQEAFDVAERFREITELDNLCLKKALKAAHNIPEDALIFFNLSPETLSRQDFQPEKFLQSVSEAGIAPHRLVIEITERRISDTSELVRHAAALQQLGIRIALDDAGAGYAGLEILGKLPLDFVKIDRLVMTRAVTEPGARAVLAGIVTIARETNTHVIAEGIETRELLDFIHGLPPEIRLGIGSIQGYLLGRPQILRPT